MTPTQKRIFDLLSDGEKHTRREVHACLADDLAELRAIRYHISKIRKEIGSEGLDVACEIHRSLITYRLVRVYQPV